MPDMTGSIEVITRLDMSLVAKNNEETIDFAQNFIDISTFNAHII